MLDLMPKPPAVILPLCWQKGLNPYNIGSPGCLMRNVALVYVFGKTK